MISCYLPSPVAFYSDALLGPRWSRVLSSWTKWDEAVNAGPALSHPVDYMEVGQDLPTGGR